MKKAVFYFLLVISLLVTEIVLFRQLKAGGVTADLFLICTVYFSVNRSSIAGMNFGFVSSLAQDAFLAGPFGLNPLLKTAIAYMAGWFKGKIYTDNAAVQAGLVFVFSLAYYWGAQLLYYLLKIHNETLLGQSLLFSGYNSLVALLVFPLMDFLVRKYVE